MAKNEMAAVCDGRSVRALFDSEIEGRGRQEDQDGESLAAANHMSSALVLERQWKYEDALKVYYKALTGYSKLEQHEKVADCESAIARILTKQGELDDALMMYHEALAIYLKCEAWREVAQSQASIGDVLWKQGEHDHALKIYYEALVAFKAVCGTDDDEKVAECQSNIASALKRQGKLADANALYCQALPTYTKVFGPKHATVASIRYGIACCHCLAGSEPEALIALEEAIVAGFSSAAHRRHIESDTELDGVRQSDEFQRILRMVDADATADARLQYDLAVTLMQQRKLDDALNAYCKALCLLLQVTHCAEIQNELLTCQMCRSLE